MNAFPIGTSEFVHKNIPPVNPYLPIFSAIEFNKYIQPKDAIIIPTLPISTVIIPKSSSIPHNTEVIPISPGIKDSVAGITSSTETNIGPYVTKKRNIFTIGEIPKEKWGVAQQQQRASEDRYQVKQIGPFRYFAVFDGHGGARQMGPYHVADYCVNNLHNRIAEKLENIDLENINEVSITLSRVLIDFDSEMYENKKQFGATCTIILVDDTRNYIYQINLGDSRSIIFNGKGIISATDDHEPSIIHEQNRITAAGGFVFSGRVNGQLMVSRAFGDFDLKRNKDKIYDPVDGMVSAIPDIKIFSKISCNGILTSDAPYERDAFNDNDLVVMSNNIIPRIPEIIAKEMVQKIYPHTTDDTTILFIVI